MGTHCKPVTPEAWLTPHKKGFEIPTPIKHAIRQSHLEGKTSLFLQMKYNLRQSTIRQILYYPTPGRAREGRKGPKILLSDAQVDKIKSYCAESWGHRILEYKYLRNELKLKCTPAYLGHRLNQRGYFR